MMQSMCRPRRGFLIALALVAGGLTGHGGATAQPMSPAEVLLFTTNHMQAISKPVSLTYAFKREGGSEPGFDDEVRLDVVRLNPDKSAAVELSFLTGPRTVDLPQLGEATGNPVVLGFLERDITEMKRLTGGATNYFRKRIRLALADTQKLHSVRLRYGNKQIDAQEIRIQPYLDDPLRDRFKELVNKSYVFVITPEVPGSVYQIRTSWGDDRFMDKPVTEGKAAVTETLTLVKEQAYSPSPPGKTRK